MSQNLPAMQLEPSLETAKDPCIGCGGTGREWCPKCHGSGEDPVAPDDPDDVPWPCTACGGEGLLGPCVNCEPEDDDSDPWLDERLPDAMLENIFRRP